MEDLNRRHSRIIVVVAAVVAAAIATAWLIEYVAMEFLSSRSNQNAIVSGSAKSDVRLASTNASSIPLLDQPRALPELRFVDGEARALTIADFRGRLILLNIWATWCGPCRREMPTLDRLQAELGGADFEVLALSIDRKGLPVVKAFYEELGLEALRIYVDASASATRDFGVVGIPTTLLVDRQGNEIGRLVGPSEWDSPEMVSFLRQRIAKADGSQTSAVVRSTNGQTRENDK